MYTNEEPASMHYMYGLADGNALETSYTPIRYGYLTGDDRISCARALGIQAHIKFIRNLISCVTIVPGVSHFIPEIRTCRRALSKYTLGQLCNHTFPGPCCHTLFFVSLYEESIPEVLPLSFNTPCIRKHGLTGVLTKTYEVLHLLGYITQVIVGAQIQHCCYLKMYQSAQNLSLPHLLSKSVNIKRKKLRVCTGLKFAVSH
jgi:hypothetical protein